MYMALQSSILGQQCTLLQYKIDTKGTCLKAIDVSANLHNKVTKSTLHRKQGRVEAC